MSSLVEDLETICSWHVAHERRAAVELCRGATVAEISAAEKLMQLKMPPALKEIFSWHNGNCAQGATLGEMSFFPDFHTLSLDGLASARPDEGVRDALGWNSGWIPFAGNGGGDFYVVDGTETSRRSRMVRLYMRGEPEHMAIYDSIESMFSTLIECFREGAYVVGGDEGLDVDVRLELAVSKSLNPGSGWWSQLAAELA